MPRCDGPAFCRPSPEAHRMRRHSLALIGLPLVLVPLALLAVRADEDATLVRPAVFPCKLGYEVRWERLRDRLPPAKTLLGWLQDDAEGQNLIRWDRERHRSLWVGIHEGIVADDQAVTSLRKGQEGPALALLRIAARHPRVLKENLAVPA